MQEHIQETWQKLATRYQNHRNTYRTNKAALILQIIQPLLRSLGWDISNPDVIQLDYRVGYEKVDFAFFDQGRCIGFILLSDSYPPTEHERVQEICRRLQLSGGIATDGEWWTLIDDQENDYSFHLTDENPRNFISSIAYLLPINLANVGEKISLIQKTGRAELLTRSWHRFVEKEELEQIISTLYESFQEEALNDQELEMEEIENFFAASFSLAIKKGTPNTALKVTLPNGQIIFHKEATKVLIETIQAIGIEAVRSLGIKVGTTKDKDGNRVDVHLIEEKPLGKIQHPVNIGDKTYYIGTGSNNKTKIEQLKAFRYIDKMRGLRIEQLRV